MMGSCVTEAAQDVGGLHHRPLSATANHLRGPQQQPLVNNQSPHSQQALYSSHHQQPQHSHSHLQHHGPHPYTASSMGSYSAGAGSMQPLSQHHAAPTSQHNMRGHSMSHMTSSSSSAGSNSFMDSGPVGYAASPPSSNGSSTTMAPPPLLPLPMSLSTRHGQQQQQHQHHQHQHQLGQQTDESTNAGFLQQLLHGGMPTDEDLVSVGGASLSLMTATYHGQQSQQQPQQQPQQQMGYGSGGGQPHSHSHNPTPASTGTPTNSSEELPCIFDELDMFQENPNSLVSPSCFSHHPATVPPQHHHAGAMEPGSGTNNSLQLLTITSAPPPLPTADAMSLEGAGGRRRKVGDLYGDMNSVGISNGDSAATADGVSHGRRGSHPGHGAKRIRYNRSRSASCSSAAAVKPEPEDFAALASPSSSSSSSAAASSETSNNIDLEEIYVGVRDQVVYWGNSKNKYDVTVCVRAPTRYCGLLKGATVSYQVSLPAMQEFKMKSRSGAKGKGKPKAETVKKAVLQLVRTESDNGVVEFEAFLKNCLPTEKLSNLTLLELHFNITLKQRAAMGKAGSEEIKASFNLGSSASSSAVRGGRRKQSVGGDDDDFEDEEDGRESLDEDEYVPTARGRGGRGGRGKANGRGGQRGKATHQRDEELESDDPAVGGMDYHQFDMAFAAADGLASIERKVPVVTYTHSKAITRALCRLIWYPMNEENTMSTDFLLEKLCKYFASQLQLPISIYDRHNLAAMLSPFTNGITYVEFYSLLGEWFVLAIKMAKKKTQCLWQQGRETFIPLLFNPYRRINNDSAATASAAGGSSSASNNNGGGDDDEWTEDNEASSESTRRTGRGRGRRSRSGSRAGLPQPTGKSTTVEDCASDIIAALQLDAVLEREGDFLVTIGPDLKERHGRAEGEEGRGVNYFPSLKYPLQIVYVKADGEKQCLSVENKLDKLTDFIHAKQCLRDYLVLQRDGVWKRVEKDQFAFNHAQQRRLEETLGRTSVLAREDSESLSYAHA